MSARDDLRAMLVRAVVQLGPVAERVVLVGGCAPAAWDLSAMVGDVRPTEDVDLIISVSTLAEYYAVAKDARLTPHVDVTRPGLFCRHVGNGILIDLMPTGRQILGFANTWYPEAFSTARRRELAPGVAIRVITPIYFVATKLEALASRGAGDYLMSQDLEDIVTAVMGMPGLTWALRTGREDVHDFIRSRFRELLAVPAFIDAWQGLARGDVNQQQGAAAALSEIRSAAAMPRGPSRVCVRIASGELEFSVPRQALAWSNTDSKEDAVLQSAVDHDVEVRGHAIDGPRQCWAPEPFDDERLVYVPVTFIACECGACAEVTAGDVPCWTCVTCLEQSSTACPRCHLANDAFAGSPASGIGLRTRTGYLLTDSLRCQIHDHDACPDRWHFDMPVADGVLRHAAACGCTCHRAART